MKGRGGVVCGGLVIALVLIGAAAGAQEALSFDLEKVSPFALQQARRYDLTELVRGQTVGCVEEPTAEVRAYPDLTSAKPLYGTVAFDRDYDKPGSGIAYAFAIDESAGTGKGYDRLYFDLNRDNDLTNDNPLAPLKDVPKGARPVGQSGQLVFFDYVDVPFDFGPGLGTKPFRVLPRLTVSESGYAALGFVATEARRGEIQMGSRRYTVVLGQSYVITGRFDRQSTAFLLSELPSLKREEWWGADTLAGMREVDGTWYSFASTPTGDRLTVQPYGGEFGLFRAGPADRDITELSMTGSLSSEEAWVPVGTVSPEGGGWPEKTREARLPVGDYLPSSLTVQFGRLSIFISDNYHSDGHPRDRQGRPRVHGIRIRKDQPFVLDFSNDPAVLFASPGKDQRYRLGETVEVKAVLVDPVLDVMVRGLHDTTRERDRISIEPDGQTHTSKEKVSLDPTVTITDSSGKEVGTGVMPFG